MDTISNPLDCGKSATPEDGEIVIVYGPTWKERHPYSAALARDLIKSGWQIGRDMFGKLRARHRFFDAAASVQ